MSSNRNNLLAGVLVTAAILGTVAAIIFLAGGAEQLGQVKYIVSFDLATGVSGLTPGAEVRVGGKKVGTVQRVEFAGVALAVIERNGVNCIAFIQHAV